MPVFEGLLPPQHNEIVLDLLFELATWHAFARLHVYTDSTLDMFQVSTKSLTAVVRRFIRETCESYMTQELPKETAARGQCTVALTAKWGSHTTKGKTSATPKGKKFNLETYKYHALADYPKMIQMFGMADNYNMQIVCPLSFGITSNYMGCRENWSISAPRSFMLERTRTTQQCKSQSTQGKRPSSDPSLQRTHQILGTIHSRSWKPTELP
jgi:hypothetical protein